ncbi:MAG: ribonuclease HI family protein [Thermodesulfobacteriales bacterium]|jgi:ribonuclease HI|nr:MAG: ribonuclease HI family protein [Thermodesulfobacteriales bacterium]
MKKTLKMKRTVKLKQGNLPIPSDKKNLIEIFIDGAARGNPGESGIGVFIRGAELEDREITKYLGTKTNNQAEYTALITALESALDLKNNKIKIFTDSLLVANQVNGVWKVKHPEIILLNKEAKKLFGNYKNISIQHIPREQNRDADRLANLAIDEYPL